ncbi:Myotubularin-related protein 1 [Heterocephalus glaber]|uniref:Myotubularin-related protein 1 n=1 Tax=Heterocephalus glaber TaxID=10181 RepID=G5C6Z3_HETGA|nr:Myotubularin-related protein 1 [Heterocephalus glaber]
MPVNQNLRELLALRAELQKRGEDVQWEVATRVILSWTKLGSLQLVHPATPVHTLVLQARADSVLGHPAPYDIIS